MKYLNDMDLDTDIDDEPVISFGKFRGCPLSEVQDHGYLNWLLTLTGDSYAANFVANHRQAIVDILMAEERSKAAAAPPITVTPHQQDAVDKILDQIDNGQHVVRLDGGAGYGKSYAVKALLMALRERGIRSRACAVSYVATQVLARDLDPYGFEAATVARTLKQAKVIDADTGVESYVLTADSYEAAQSLLSPGSSLVLDECSMGNDEIAGMLIDSAERHGGTLILVGDDHQLPPVKQETLSIACQTLDPATLTEPMRYSRESPLFALEQAARINPHIVLNPTAFDPAHDEIRRLDRVDQLVHAYAENFRADPGASHRMLLFRRVDVNAANNHIRSVLFGDDAPLVVEGERLMVLRTSDYPYVPNAKIGDTQRYYSGEAFIVEDMEQQTYTAMGVDIPHWVVKFQGRQDPVRVVFAITESSMDRSKLGGAEYEVAIGKAFAHGRETKDWEPLKLIQSQFVSVAYQYATSVHRAQGQTTDYAYVAPRQLLQVGGLIGNALAYVALTRARKQCCIVA